METALLKYALPAIFVMAQAIMILLNQQKQKKQNGQYRYNPHPPGEAVTCQKHTEMIQRHGEALARLEECSEGIEKRLDRMEVKLNGTR